jgi:hypothetical protein
MLTVFDTLSDYSAYAVLQIDGSGYATPMLVVLVVSMACQSFITRYVTKEEGNFVTAGALFGFKPVLDGINIVFDLEPQTGALPSLIAFGWTRVVETIRLFRFRELAGKGCSASEPPRCTRLGGQKR